MTAPDRIWAKNRECEECGYTCISRYNWDKTPPNHTPYLLATPAREKAEELVEALRRVPSALGDAFAAGAEEREGGSARRQAKAWERVEALRSDVRAILASLENTKKDASDG